MSRRIYADDDIKKIVEENSECEFIGSYMRSTKSNRLRMLKLTCGCGDDFEVAWVKFNRSDGKPQRQCPSCGRKARGIAQRMTDEEYTKRKAEKGIEIKHLEPPKGRGVGIKHQCPVCESEDWKPTPANVLAGLSTKCSECHLSTISGHNKLDDEKYQQEKKDKGIDIKNTEPYISGSIPIYHICPECKKEVKVRPSAVLRGWNMCEPCSYTKRAEDMVLTDSEVHNAVQELGGKWVSGEYKGKDSVLVFECECGSEFSKRFSDFCFGWTRCSNCTASLSTGEYHIKKWLTEKKLPFTHQRKFDELRGKRKMPLSYDFSIDDEKGNPIKLIEYDGEHHFKPIYYRFPTRAKAEQEFKKVQKYDKIKNKFAESKNIPLLRISSKQYEKLDELLKHLL